LSLKLLSLAFVLPKKDSGVTEKEITRDGMPFFFAAKTSFLVFLGALYGRHQSYQW
jgi:hypothetical protein